MTFKSNREMEGLSIGNRLRLLQDVRVLKGTFFRGSIMRVTGDLDARGEMLFVDEDSGESVYFSPSMVRHEPVTGEMS